MYTYIYLQKYTMTVFESFNWLFDRLFGFVCNRLWEGYYIFD